MPKPKIVPDARHPALYRIQYADGSLSEMVNLTRAKDALASLVTAYERSENATQTS